LKQFIEKAISAPGLYPILVKIRLFTGKYFFLVLCVAGLLWYAIFTRHIIGQIKKDSVAVTQSYAELIKTAISERMNDEEIEVIFTEVIQKLSFPIIITDTLWNPITWKNIAAGPFFNRRAIPFGNLSADDRSELAGCIKKFKREYEPKTIYLSGTSARTGYLVYSNSDIVKSMAWLPFVELGLILAVMVFAYIAFHNIRVNERSNLWVGLAKETAHQLGTPISSLMGWVEYMRSAGIGPDSTPPEEVLTQMRTICDNMEHDLTRLRKVTARFSQIGSIPALTPCNINGVLEDVMKYFRMRLPLLGRHIIIKPDFTDLPPVPANHDLIEWVFENLMKNSLDAINKPEGLIEIRTEYLDLDKRIRILHKDNGKGIAWEDQKKVFSPGFTTKNRGWGLGLTLAKRIVEDYHKGQIYVSWSQKDRGTIFCIDLPASA
jgi:signal transduction histidine kinase